MTREQKQRLAAMVINQVANLTEFWDEALERHDLKDIDTDEAMQQIADWLGKLPGRAWDKRLPDPAGDRTT